MAGRRIPERQEEVARTEKKATGTFVQAMTQEKSVISLCLFTGTGGLHLDVHLMLSYSAKAPMIW